MITEEALIIFAANWLVYLSLGVLPCLLLKGKRRDLLRILFSLAAAMAIEKAFDLLFRVPRPFVAGEFNPLVSVPAGEYYASFPSGHATFMAALAMAVSFSNRATGVLLWVLALFTGVGRVLAGVHYPADILGGFVVGSAVASLVAFFDVRYTDQLLKKLRKRPALS